MGRFEQMLSPLSSGAGRWIDQIWPDPLQFDTTAASVTQARNRLLGTQVAMATGGFGGGGATLNLVSPATYGNTVVRMAAGGADGVGQLARFTSANVSPSINQVQSRTLYGVPTSDYQALGASRVYAVYAYNAFGGGSAVADSGLECSMSGGLIQSQSAKGVGFCRSATNVIIARCQTIGGGASSNVAVTGAGTAFPAFNSALLNAYELQFTSATATAEATIAWLINGVIVRRLSYGGGSVLPTFSGTVNSVFTVLLPNVGANVNMDVLAFHVISAPTIAQCY